MMKTTLFSMNCRRNYYCLLYTSHIITQAVIIIAPHKLDGRPGPQIRAADSDHDQYIAAFANLLCCGLNPFIFFFIIIYGTANPSQKVKMCIRDSLCPSGMGQLFCIFPIGPV